MNASAIEKSSSCGAGTSSASSAVSQSGPSSASDGAYPVDWQIRVPATGLDLRVRAAIPGQELVTQRSGGVAYWEGAVIVDGTREGRVVGGRGYLEMTGYAGRSITDVLQ